MATEIVRQASKPYTWRGTFTNPCALCGVPVRLGQKVVDLWLRDRSRPIVSHVACHSQQAKITQDRRKDAMTQQHSPTPFRIGGRDGSAWTITDERSTHAAFPAIFGANGNRICNVDSHEEEDCDANARYIVQACNNFEALLGALQDMVEWCEEIQDDDSRAPADDMERARAALAAATTGKG